MTKKDAGPVYAALTEQNICLVLPLRDWFAGMALQGILASKFGQWTYQDKNHLPEVSTVAADAFAFADAMLKEQEV